MMRTRLLVVALTLLCASLARAHWADLAVMEVAVRPEGARITLTVPSGLIRAGDVDGDGKVSPEEVMQRATRIAEALSTKVQLLTPGRVPVVFRVVGGGKATGARVDPRVATDAPGDSHVAIKLEFDPAPLQGLRLHYDLWVADAPQASCLATILREGKLSQHVFNPRDRDTTVGEPLSDGMFSRGLTAPIHLKLPLLCLFVLLIGIGTSTGIAAAAFAFLVSCAAGIALTGRGALQLDPGLIGALAVGSVLVAAGLNLSAASGGRVLIAAAFGLIHGVDLVRALLATVPQDELSALLPLYAAGTLATMVVLALLFTSWAVLLKRKGDAARHLRTVLTVLAALSAAFFGLRGG